MVSSFSSLTICKFRFSKHLNYIYWRLFLNKNHLLKTILAMYSMMHFLWWDPWNLFASVENQCVFRVLMGQCLAWFCCSLCFITVLNYFFPLCLVCLMDDTPPRSPLHISLLIHIFYHHSWNSDIRGVAVDGVEGEPVNLTEPVTEAIAAAFAAWLLDRKKLDSSTRLKVSVGHDSRISAQKLQVSVIWALGLYAGCIIPVIYGFIFYAWSVSF